MHNAGSLCLMQVCKELKHIDFFSENDFSWLILSVALFLCICYQIIINYTRVYTINHIRISTAMGNKQTNKVYEAKIRKKTQPNHSPIWPDLE